MSPLDRTRAGTFLCLAAWQSSRPFSAWRDAITERLSTIGDVDARPETALRGIEQAGATIGGWAALADQALDADDSLSDTARDNLRDVLYEIAELGARAHAAALEVRTRIEADQ